MKAQSASTLIKKKLASYSIKILKRNAIESNKWDVCLKNSVNESPLAYTWVLDHLAPDWQGLIIGNYEAIMPLPTQKDFGIVRIQLPFDVHNLGIFSPDPALVNLKSRIFDLPCFNNFHFIAYSFMPDTEENVHKRKESSLRKNYELSLSDDYQTLYKRFSKSHKKNIRRFTKNNLSIDRNLYPESYNSLKINLSDKIPALFSPHDHNNRFNNMVIESINKNTGEIYTISKDNNVIGSAFFLKGEKRTIVFHISDQKGRILKTTFGLLNHFICRNASKNIILDFAGSEIDNIAKFNSGFGAIQKKYEYVEINRLPLLLKTIKKANLRYKMNRLFYRHPKQQ